MTRSFLKYPLLLLLFLASALPGQERTPLAAVKSVVDKVIREAAFEFKLEPQKTAAGLQVVDFNQAFGNSATGTGYAVSYIESKDDVTVQFGLSSAGTEVLSAAPRISGWRLAMRRSSGRSRAPRSASIQAR